MQSRQAPGIDESEGADAIMTGASVVPATIEIAINTSAHQPPPEQRSQRLRDKIAELVERSSSYRNYEADTVRQVARAALLDGVVDVSAIEKWLGAICPQL